MTKCWYYNVDELKSPEKFSESMIRLPWEDRRDKVTRYRFGKDKRLCLGAGLVASHALREFGVYDLTLGYSKEGKPFLASATDIYFNLSHSGKYAVCAVSGRPVGVDVEEIRSYEEDVARLCFLRKERDWAGREEDLDKAFYRLWTRKESYMKCLGQGFSLDPLSFSVVPGAETCKGYRFWETAIGGHQVCVCAPEGEEVLFREYPAQPIPI